jgi:hypothetical protein
MSGGHYVAEMLVAIATRYDLSDGAVRASFLQAGLALDADHDFARVLVPFLTKVIPTPAEAAAILRSVTRMNADYDKCRVLIALAPATRLDGALRDAYMRAAATLRQDYERAQALRALARVRSAGL